MNKVITIRVLSGSPQLIGKKLYLERQGDTSTYVCKNTGIEVFDMWNELLVVDRFSNGTGNKMQFDMLLLTEAKDKSPLFIESIKFYDTKTCVYTIDKTVSFLFRLRQLFRMELSFKTLLPNGFPSSI